MQASTSDTDLAEHLGILKGVHLEEGLDYDTIGKIVVASILRENAENLRTQEPDSEGHILIKSNVHRSAKVHTKPSIVVCCICENSGGILICRGQCCDWS